MFKVNILIILLCIKEKKSSMGAIFSHWVELCNEQGGRQLLKNNGELILVSVCCFSINLPWLHQWYCEAIGFETCCFLPWMIISLRWCWKKFIFVVPKLVCNIQWWRDGHICQDKGPESQEKVESGQIFLQILRQEWNDSTCYWNEESLVNTSLFKSSEDWENFSWYMLSVN